MYMVYWTEVMEDMNLPHARLFESDAMRDAMSFLETLRARQRAGEAVCFVTLSSENPDSVGRAGVADPSPDYNWKKRRT